MRRIVVFIDEIEKVFPTGNELDSGVSADQLSVWLTELSDPKRLYYVVASANQCSKLPAPLLRSGRFDAIVMIDIPKPSQQQVIWEIMRERYGIDPATPLPEYYRWTGAEIEACCDGADAKGCTLVQAAKTVVPVHSLNPEEIKKVQDYAKGRAIDAETGELYTGYFDEPDQVTSVPGSRRGTNRLNPAIN
jgi:SpoVK/Ycf46/Vps4 family AAA+-type ATPase